VRHPRTAPTGATSASRKRARTAPPARRGGRTARRKSSGASATRRPYSPRNRPSRSPPRTPCPSPEGSALLQMDGKADGMDVRSAHFISYSLESTAGSRHISSNSRGALWSRFARSFSRPSRSCPGPTETLVRHVSIPDHHRETRAQQRPA